MFANVIAINQSEFLDTASAVLYDSIIFNRFRFLEENYDYDSVVLGYCILHKNYKIF